MKTPHRKAVTVTATSLLLLLLASSLGCGRMISAVTGEHKEGESASTTAPESDDKERPCSLLDPKEVGAAIGPLAGPPYLDFDPENAGYFEESANVMPALGVLHTSANPGDGPWDGARIETLMASVYFSGVRKDVMIRIDTENSSVEVGKRIVRDLAVKALEKL